MPTFAVLIRFKETQLPVVDSIAQPGRIKQEVQLTLTRQPSESMGWLQTSSAREWDWPEPLLELLLLDALLGAAALAVQHCRHSRVIAYRTIDRLM